MRGDRPEPHLDRLDELLFTPHARGSTAELNTILSLLHVYPACAGIDPLLVHNPLHRSGLPRMRGDRPP